MTTDGAIERFVLRGEGGFAVSVLTLGAAVQSILAPDHAGRLAEMVLGHDDPEEYRRARNFFGATIGRCANRIARGRFALGGGEVRIAPNDGANVLHGGARGFDTQLFEVAERSAEHLVLARTSPDGEEGFPGTLAVRVAYRVRGTTLLIEMEARTDRETVVNLTNHSYFNLAGGGSALGHDLAIEADRILAVSPEGIPTGAFLAVDGTPFDFRTPRRIEARVRQSHPQLTAMRGYDHNWCLTGGRTAVPRPVATLRDPASGRRLVLSTTEAGLQFYSGNSLDGSASGHGGEACRQGDGVCLEPQAWPDAPNHPGFPSVALQPAQTYRHAIAMHFAGGEPS